jgi:hypothetical protein
VTAPDNHGHASTTNAAAKSAIVIGSEYGAATRANKPG